MRTYVIAGPRTRYPGITRNRAWRVDVLECEPDRFPAALAHTRPRPHSWEAFVEHEINRDPGPVLPSGGELVLRVHQQEQVDAIRDAVGGYTLAYPTGSGKTLMAVLGVSQRAPSRVLVICTVTHVPAWQSTISEYGRPDTEWVVVNPERLGSLLTSPDPFLGRLDATDRDAFLAREGVPFTDWDVVIADEAHFLADPGSLRSRMWRRLTRWGAHGPEAFTVNLSATPWTDPTQTWPAAHVIARALGVECPGEDVIAEGYRDFLAGVVSVASPSARARWHWHDSPEDVARLTALLYEDGRGAVAAATDIDQPTQERSLHHITLTPAERAAYEKPWAEFRDLHQLPKTQALTPDEALTRRLRQVQKASLLKLPYVAALAVDYVARGYQVILPAWYQDTARELATHCARGLRDRGLSSGAHPVFATLVTGDTDRAQRENRIRSFQSGRAAIIVTSITQSINLHAGEHAGGLDGQDASPTPRVTIFADVLTGGKRAFQAEGRGQRDGQVAPVVYVVADDTTEQDWMSLCFAAMADTRALTSRADPSDIGAQYDVANLMSLSNALERA